jgi:hypothetical protein
MIKIDYLNFDSINSVTTVKDSFYDTFTFPFSKKIDSWKDLPNKFSNRSFLYNSFLLMEI